MFTDTVELRHTRWFAYNYVLQIIILVVINNKYLAVFTDAVQFWSAGRARVHAGRRRARGEGGQCWRARFLCRVFSVYGTRLHATATAQGGGGGWGATAQGWGRGWLSTFVFVSLAMAWCWNMTLDRWCTDNFSILKDSMPPSGTLPAEHHAGADGGGLWPRDGWGRPADGYPTDPHRPWEHAGHQQQSGASRLPCFLLQALHALSHRCVVSVRRALRTAIIIIPTHTWIIYNNQLHLPITLSQFTR